VSRVGRMPVTLPKGVSVNIEGQTVSVKGPRGELAREVRPEISVKLEGNELIVSRSTDERAHRAYHGLTRALLANMVKGVSEGFRKVMMVEGVGYRAAMQGGALVLQLGYSHPIEVLPPPGVTFSVEKGEKVFTIEGINKELVGEIAAKIRSFRKPEPYKGKGVLYQGERVRRKAGKAGKVGG
jgi:large subunit ribosomal protein L6